MAVTWSIRPAEPVDAESILAISDDAAAWLVDHGLSDQWGPEPPSSEPSFVSRVSSWIADGEAAVAVDANGDVHGYAIIGCLPPPYYDEAVALRAVEDALYVYTLGSRMKPASRGVGRSLMSWAARQARARELSFLRLDCWADNPRLRSYYESLGFSECDSYVDDGWNGVVMESRV